MNTITTAVCNQINNNMTLQSGKPAADEAQTDEAYFLPHLAAKEDLKSSVNAFSYKRNKQQHWARLARH